MTLLIELTAASSNLPSYLAAYDTATGQVFLAAALIGYGALILRVQRLAAFPRPGRFLTGAGMVVGADRVIVR